MTIDELIGVLEKYKEEGASGDANVKIDVVDVKNLHRWSNEITAHGEYSDGTLFLQTSIQL